MAAALEENYRQWLRWYPRAWLARRGDAMVGTLMDVAESEHRENLGPGERRSIAIHGVRARFEEYLPSRARKIAATIAVSAGFAISVVTFVMSSWSPLAVTPPPFAAGYYSRFGPFFDIGPTVDFFWLVAFAAALLGQWRLGRLALVASIVITAVMPRIAEVAHPQWLSVDRATLTLLGLTALVGILGTPQRGRWLIGAVAAWTAVYFAIYLRDPSVDARNWSSTNLLWESATAQWWLGLFIVAIAIVCIALKRRALALAIILSIAPWVTALFRANETRLWTGMGVGAALLAGLEFLSLVTLLVLNAHASTPDPQSQQQPTVGIE
jgi:hypothetical protein